MKNLSKKISLIIIPTFLSFFVSATAFAQEAEGAEEAFEGFYMFEVVGAIIAVISLISLVRAAVAIGGDLGKTFKLYAVALILVTFSLIWRAYMEFAEAETFIGEIIFELPIYIGLILMLFGSIKARKTATGQ